MTKRETFWVGIKRKTSGGVYNQRIVVDSNQGYRHSLEARANMSAAKKGCVFTPEARANMSASHKGKSPSLETRKSMSASRKGKKAPLESRARMSAAQKGHMVSTETRAKISIANRKLTSSQVASIKALKKCGLSNKDVASNFNVSEETVRRIIVGSRYADVK